LGDNSQAWIFHGDVFDVTMQHSKWLTKLGAIGYDSLILINRLVNFVSEKVFRRGKISLSKRIKNSVKSAVKFINNFELTSAEIGISNNYQYVICGHIHHPEIREISNDEGSIMYLNSGDWIENLSALEYNDGRWSIYRYNDSSFADTILSKIEEENDPSNNELFSSLLSEFRMMKQTM
jgi:UDP-2,3-diacylglucosamine pyrophosphatase LpxH